jgi:hypothetical protein
VQQGTQQHIAGDYPSEVKLLTDNSTRRSHTSAQ